MAERLKAVIIGCGKIGFNSHAKVLLSPELIQEVELAGFSRSRQELANERQVEIERAYGVKVPAYGNVKDMIAETLPNVAHICSPADCHLQSLEQALKSVSLRGVLMEKPLFFDKSIRGSKEKSAKIAELCLQNNIYLDTTVQTEYLAKAYFEWLQTQSVKLAEKFNVKWTSTKESPIEKWIDIGPHIVKMLDELPFICWGRAQTQYERESVKIKVYAEKGLNKFPVDITVGGQERSFGYDGFEWTFSYDKERDGYRGIFEGKEVSFIPDPMKQKITDYYLRLQQYLKNPNQEQLEKLAREVIQNHNKVLVSLRH